MTFSAPPEAVTLIDERLLEATPVVMPLRALAVPIVTLPRALKENEDELVEPERLPTIVLLLPIETPLFAVVVTNEASRPMVIVPLLAIPVEAAVPVAVTKRS